MDTIFAQATASGRAGVSIIRLSGVQAYSIASEFCNIPLAGRSGLRSLKAADKSLIDKALVLFFEIGASFTGEQVIEFHVHGGLATVAKLLSELSAFDGCRLASPGEFTRRALENGQLDLNQVEALSDLIDAETESQRKQAISVLEGSFGELGKVWRADLLRAVALLEASIDFSDEEIPNDLYLEVLDLVRKTKVSVSSVLDRSSIASKIRSGFTVAIVGTPNVGKSTLLNAIAGRPAAITSDVAGTTRDVIETRVDLKGLAVTFLDTAGLRESDDFIENIGISMAYKASDAADIRIFLVERDNEVLPFPARPDDFVVLNKADLGAKNGLSVSGKTGEGVSELLNVIAERLLKKTSLDVVAIRERQIKGLHAASALLMKVMALTEQKPLAFELACQELYFALSELDFVFGKIDIEGVLDEIFSSFCLGK
jgi:tRNA modification GTPase